MITVREAYLLSISRFLSKRNTKSANPTILFKQTSLANFISIQNTSFAINLPILAHMCLCESRPTDRLMSNYADSKHIPAPSQTANLARNVPFFNPSSSQRHSHSRGFPEHPFLMFGVSRDLRPCDTLSDGTKIRQHFQVEDKYYPSRRSGVQTSSSFEIAYFFPGSSLDPSQFCASQ